MSITISRDNSPACLMLAPLSPTPAAPSGGEDGVDLVEEDGGGGVVPGHLEQGAHLYVYVSMQQV